MQKPEPSWFESEKNEAMALVNAFCKAMQAKGYEFVFEARHPFGMDLSASRGAPVSRLGFAEAVKLKARGDFLQGLEAFEDGTK